ncbi:putative peptidase M41, FtsH extracellular, P-loop containing nucleoside triphosphate hydrolase [Helianthus annuus]|nr:putative peptidase M41, FtsH extracellular, P-loop containing nucleoside triphosphate hydrolase [Helianthus annuus]
MKCRTQSYMLCDRNRGSGLFPVVSVQSYNRLVCVRSVKNENGNKENNLRNRETSFFRRGFKLRLQPRLRLMGSKLKRVSVRSMLNELGDYLRKNMRKVTLYTSVSVVLGLCYLFLKLTAVPSPKIVPYSDLITNLHSGSVMKVLFEEGSRRIYYNTESFGKENTQKQESNVGINDDVVKDTQITGSNAVQKLTKTKTSTPEWQFSTRKIDHDESYLLGLMREKGITYSSSPQSVLMSMRNTLITILSLWIPLTPLMWLLYRQLSAANSPAKKRRPSNQVVNFEDVEGVDTAKVELMEIVLCLKGSINYNKLGAKLPRGVLLVGPPGPGKRY